MAYKWDGQRTEKHSPNWPCMVTRVLDDNVYDAKWRVKYDPLDFTASLCLKVKYQLITHVTYVHLCALWDK